MEFETDLSISNDEALLSISNEERVNRQLATQEHIGKTSFSAYLAHVQYGTYDDKPACLVAIDFSFRFPSKASSRFTSAEVELTFEKALNRSKPSLRSTDASLDPIVANFAPKKVLGQVKTRENKKTWEIEVPVTFEAPFGSVGITGSFASETAMTEEGRSEVHGNRAQDDAHDDGANAVTWDFTENSLSKEGILRSFRSAIILWVRPKEAFWMHVSVKPVVKFSINPNRLFTKRLLQDRDDPILLDGEQTLGTIKSFGVSKFDSDDFPWHEMLSLPKELGR
jgi:hypothetical protein